MRIAVASLVSVCVAVVLAPTAGATTAPTLRVIPGSTPSIQGTGFVPRTIVRLRVTGSGVVLRLILVRSGSGGGFSVKLPIGSSCGVTVVNAAGAGTRHARVATGLARQCPPPPPIRAPGSG